MSAEQPPSTDLIKTPDSPILFCDTCDSDKVRVIEAGRAVVKRKPEALLHHVYICCGECCQERERYVSDEQLDGVYRASDIRAVGITNDYIALKRVNFADAIDAFVQELDMNIVTPEDF